MQPLPILMLALAQLVAPNPRVWDGERYVVHEWGTFTEVRGSDGVVLSGLLHESFDLPEFVHDLRDECGLSAMSPKMETPVIYFYAPREWPLRVTVDFPRGAFTQWYPGVSDGRFTPEESVATGGARRVALRDGRLRWGGAWSMFALGPEDSRAALAALAPVAEDDPWRHARLPEANVLRVCNRALGERRRRDGDPEAAAYSLRRTGNRSASGALAAAFPEAMQHERFLFYRGLGAFELPLAVDLVDERDEAGAVRIDLRGHNRLPGSSLRAPFLVRVTEGGEMGYARLAEIGERIELYGVEFALAPRAEMLPRLEDVVAEALGECGLYADEALAMVRTWSSGWFGDEGLRLFYVLPGAFVDGELPLEVREELVREGAEVPLPPDEVTRVFVARLELLTPRREAELARDVAALVSGDDAARLAAEERFARLGRFAAPWLQRARALTDDPRLQAAIDRRLSDADADREAQGADLVGE